MSKNNKKLNENESEEIKSNLIKTYFNINSTIDILNRYQNKVNLAVKNHKIFTIYGDYKHIRLALQKRGWLEKCSANYLPCLHILSIDTLLKLTEVDKKYETMLMSKMIQSNPVTFLWLPKIVTFYKNKLLNPYCNHIKISKSFDFTTKDGFIKCIEHKHWHTINDLCSIEPPPLYCLTNIDEYCEFFKEYRITYCLSLLQFIYESKDLNKLCNKDGKIPIKILENAIERIIDEIKYKENSYLDNESLINNLSNLKDWNYFCNNVNSLINQTDKFHSNRSVFKKFYIQINELMIKIKLYWPKLYNYGYKNLWILKPARSCRGLGILIKSQYDDIINYVEYHKKDTKYIVQKYIERPLLIYDTKFDIRQYILVTITDHLINIWIYKNCYLRFSSQKYTLDNLDNSIHITNYAIQKQYKNCYDNPKLPNENMWSLNEFQSYLCTKGKPHIWNNRIFPGIIKNIIAIIRASLDEMLITPNLYEFYGCDYMLDENYEPILIEINSTPDMSSTTNITKNICPDALEDLIKVVIDLPENPLAPTGKFQLVHSVKYSSSNTSNHYDIEIIGKKLEIKKKHII